MSRDDYLARSKPIELHVKEFCRSNYVETRNFVDARLREIGLETLPEPNIVGLYGELYNRFCVGDNNQECLVCGTYKICSYQDDFGDGAVRATIEVPEGEVPPPPGLLLCDDCSVYMSYLIPDDESNLAFQVQYASVSLARCDHVRYYMSGALNQIEIAFHASFIVPESAFQLHYTKLGNFDDKSDLLGCLADFLDGIYAEAIGGNKYPVPEQISTLVSEYRHILVGPGCFVGMCLEKIRKNPYRRQKFSVNLFLEKFQEIQNNGRRRLFRQFVDEKKRQ